MYLYHSPVVAPAPLAAQIGVGISVPSIVPTVVVPAAIVIAVAQVFWAFTKYEPKKTKNVKVIFFIVLEFILISGN